MHKLLKKFTVDFLNNDVKRINNILNRSFKKIVNKNNTRFDPVTDVDIKLEKIILKRIKDYFPSHHPKIYTIFSVVTNIKYDKRAFGLPHLLPARRKLHQC